MVVMFSDRPSRMMANFSTFLEVNFRPGARILGVPTKWLMIMPRNMAITAPPITWMGSRLSSQVATNARATDRARPGIFFVIFINCAPLVYWP